MLESRQGAGVEYQTPAPRLDDPPIGVAPGSRTGLLLPGEPGGRIVETERRLIEIAPDEFVDAIIGYRSWRLYMHDGFAELWSVFSGHSPWPLNGTKESECECSPERVHDQHTCGIYAWKDRPIMSSLGMRRRVTVVDGEVALWGDVHVHEHGFRADYARPIGLFLTGDRKTDMLCEVTAIQYGIPVMR